ncbi:DUF4112 domain-containing protein [Actomonas aquatica]|uniref:DUF4112 domain-containing protein n=1 Tax=Actomonas aquatica TaxID=2866162 RepID=A0ABZ1C9F7_9BACT|nr:DUF4112 domain-containing protein [Opitutus sp. WL0086]WRQ88332.1 DUF4112 domain-containing protein [Opitutus sp. WL0086]
MPKSSAIDQDPRLRRVRGLARVLDSSIPLGGGRRIGLDPIIGLLPGGGDAIGAIFSCYILWEGARLGVPGRNLWRMAGNILLETVVGAVPIAGDLFDFAWQANVRNVRLIERTLRSGAVRPSRSRKAIATGVLVAAIAFVLLVAALAWWILASLWGWLHGLLG